MDRTLLGIITPGQNGLGSNDNEGVLRIPRSCSITEASPLDSLMSYPWHSLGECYPPVEKQSVYSAAPVNCPNPQNLNDFANGANKNRIPGYIFFQHLS